FWGQDSVDWEPTGSTTGSPARWPAGKLPGLEAWTRLEVSADKVGLKPGDVITGWAFSQDRGTVYWDHSGIVSRVAQQGLKGTPLPPAGDSDFTAEMWVRLTSDKAAYLMGNMVVAGEHPAVSSGAARG